MKMEAICGAGTKASKRYMWRMLFVMSGYVLTVWGTTSFVREHQPHGRFVYVLAMLPTFPVLCMLGVVALYLREEQDEFQRVLVVRSLLGAIAGTLAMTVFADFLRSYGALTALPPFTEFVVFWVLFGIVQGAQSAMNRVGGDEDPA